MIVSFDVNVSVSIADLGFLMRALLSILLTVWLNLLVSHPTLAEKRVGREGRCELLWWCGLLLGH